MMLAVVQRDTCHGTPLDLWRITKASTPIAATVSIVSRRLSPLLTLDEPTVNVITSADSRFAAVSNDSRVRVESSKNRLQTVRPRSAGTFGFGRWFTSTMWSVRSRIRVTASGPISEIERRCFIELTEHMAEVNTRPNPKVPALRGRTVCNMFFEDSTRTRLSFETAAKRLSADVMTFTAGSSSVNKGESLRDTVETVAAMGVDAFVIRHKSSGVPWQVSRWTTASIINGGDGWHAHPTQALLDAYTVRSVLGRTSGFDGLRIAIVGDIRHSRVARSTIEIFSMLGADVTLVAPATLLPPTPLAAATDDLDAVIADVDVLYLLRMQRERIADAVVPSLREYSARFGLTADRATRLPKSALVMHPGPINRGVEIAVDPAELPGAVITKQVSNGVAVRMAVLFDLLASGGLE